MIGRCAALAAVLFALASPSRAQDAVTPLPQTEEDMKAGRVLIEAVGLLKAKRTAEAVALFDKVAADYESTHKDADVLYYSARTLPETLLYAVEVANKGKAKAIVVSANWGYAYYFKGYALMELRRVAEAKPALSRAVALSPQNSQFLSELGYIQQLEKNWPVALATYQSAEAAAAGFSPPNSKTAELGRALRGQGYVYVELNRLDDAEKAYRKCLDLNKDDQLAANELRYIQTQKAAGKPR